MSRLRRSRVEEETAVDISPLIDVVFILLIFFMVSTTFVKDNKLDIERPGAASASAAPAKALRISIDRTGAITMDNVPVRPWMVQSRVREALSGGDVEAVLVITDRRVAAERLIEVVDQARLAGATDVGVVTNAESGGS
jgi:biopolymer transport protein ExbD